MSSVVPSMQPESLPSLPAPYIDFIRHVANNPQVPLRALLEPYKEYDAKLRCLFAQQPDHPATSEPNIVPIFCGHEQSVKIRARNPNAEPDDERERYMMPLSKKDRKPNGSPAIVQSLKEFQKNFAVFSESSLSEMDWSNVVVAGSAALTPLLPVPDEYADTKRGLRKFYHEKVAPASDVDIFLYGLSEEQAKDKIKKIEQHIKDSVLSETTVVRTKNAITIVSEYPTRHVQIVLRIYRSISEILTGFDVDCSCVAYDGTQVWASPRALTAWMTQVNEIDLNRRSPSYENRLSKYARRGFEVHWPSLERDRINPTIFERSFKRVVGLARLLVLEKLPDQTDRDAYADQRRLERGRPAIDRNSAFRWKSHGDIKSEHEYEIADWMYEDDVSDYNTFVIPYGPKYHARKIEKLLYKKDLLLNADWNRPKDRGVNLHRHPAFFGNAEDVVQDCCGYCPEPVTPEEKEVAEKESKRYVSGEISFLKDNPGRQAIGSFNPITDTDWTEMAYIANTESLCKAIVDQDLELVQNLLDQDDVDPNHRDWTGRTPLQLAVLSSTPQIVQCLIDNGARIVSRVADGKTALHMAAMRGSVEMVSALLRKSEANEEEEAKQEDRRARARGVPTSKGVTAETEKTDEDPDFDIIDSSADIDDHADATTEHSYVKVKPSDNEQDISLPEELGENEPDVYDVDVCAWDIPVSALHLAIINGHVDVVKLLVTDFGANVLLPIKLTDRNKSSINSILPLVIASKLPLEEAKHMVEVLLNLGASTAQADARSITAFHYLAAEGAELLDSMLASDKHGVARALNHVTADNPGYRSSGLATPLTSAILKSDEITAVRLLEAGIHPNIDFNAVLRSYRQRFGEDWRTDDQLMKVFKQYCVPPVMLAVKSEFPSLAVQLLDKGADINSAVSWEEGYGANSQTKGITVLDSVRNKKRSLVQYLEPRKEEEKPHTLSENAAECLDGLVPDSYAHWSLEKRLEHARAFVEKRREEHDRRKANPSSRKHLSAEKDNAVHTLLQEYIVLEKQLIDRGAKTYLELHPDAKPHDEKNPFHHHHPNNGFECVVDLGFHTTDAAGKRGEAYQTLFQACWTGDVDTIRRLTTTIWDDGNPPLKVAVVDFNGFSTFGIAVLRGHLEAAKIILEIAKVQFDFKQQDKKDRFRKRALDGNQEYESEDDDNGINIVTEVIDERFTIEDVGVVPAQASGDMSALSLLVRNMPVSHFIESLRPSVEVGCKIHVKHYFRNTSKFDISLQYSSIEEDGKHIQLPGNLIQFAIFNNDIQLLSYLLDLGSSSALHSAGTKDSTSSFCPVSEQDFHFAIRLGRTQLLEEIIIRTGAGMPLENMIKKIGAKLDLESGQSPSYYRGLSVHGKKRHDWAQAGRETHSSQVYRPESPLMLAVSLGNSKSLEWFASDSLKRCYLEFASANKEDARLQNLSKLSGGVEKAIVDWLNTDLHLLAHRAIHGYNLTTSEQLDMMKLVLEKNSSLVHKKNREGETPLQAACSQRGMGKLTYPTPIIELLIQAGSDQATRNKMGSNILHSLLRRTSGKPELASDLRHLLNLIDPDILPGLFVQKSSEAPGSVTPLALYLHESGARGHWSEELNKYLIETISTFLDFSKGAELELINGEGDTPMHAEVRHKNSSLLQTMLSHKPDLLWRENAVGRTPYEVAKDAHMANCFSSPPAILGLQHESILEKNFTNPSRYDRSDDSEKVLNVCASLDRETEDVPKKRTLVSLFEANEVAKRLADKKSRQNKQKEEGEEEEEEESYSLSFSGSLSLSHESRSKT